MKSDIYNSIRNLIETVVIRFLFSERQIEHNKINQVPVVAEIYKILKS